MGAAENKATLLKMYEGFSTGNVDVVDECCAEGFVDHDPDPGMGSTAEDVKKTVAKYYEAMPDMKMHVEDLIAEGNQLVSRVKVTGTYTGALPGMPPPQGQSIALQGIEIATFNDAGKITERRGVFDMSSFMMQIGAMEPPEG